MKQKTALTLVAVLMMMVENGTSSSLHSYFASPSSKNICSLEIDRGRCNNQTMRWYYENNSKKCLIFKWSGCGGNKNNFRSKIECQQKCGLSKVPRIRHQHRRRRRHRPHQHSNNLYNTQKHHFNNNLQHVSSNHPNTCSCYRPMLFSLLLQQAQLQQQLQQLLLQQQQHLLSLQPLLPLPQFFQQNTQRTFKSKMNSDSNNHNNMKRDNDDFFPDHYDYNEYKDYQYNFYNDNSNENHQNNNIESIKNDDSYGSHNDKSYPPNGDVNIHEGGHVEITTFSPINNHIQLPRSNENYNWYLNQPEQQNSPKSYSNDYNNIQNNGIYANHQPKNSNPQVNYHETYSQPKFDSHSNEDLSKKSQMELKNKKAHMKLSRLPNEKYFMQESPVINKIKTKLCQKLPYHGPCNQEVQRWAYNWDRNGCIKFQYGGCLGNENNFRDKQSCEDYCGNLKKY